jgi:isopropylmalate/homocitrate/citramalate synthase
MLKDVAMSKEHRDIYLGHKPKDVEKAYTMAEIENLREEFRNALPFLDPDYKEDEHVTQLKELAKKEWNKEITDQQAKELLKKYMSFLMSRRS